MIGAEPSLHEWVLLVLLYKSVLKIHDLVLNNGVYYFVAKMKLSYYYSLWDLPHRIFYTREELWLLIYQRVEMLILAKRLQA